MPRSMTAFAQAELKEDWGTLRAELRSVNHRYLDISLALPERLKGLEHNLRDLLREGVKRGKLSLGLTYELEGQSAADLPLNQDMVRAYVQACESIAGQMTNPAALNPADILKFPGVLGVARDLPENMEDRVAQLLEKLLADFVDSRSREGEALKAVVLERLDAIAAQVDIIQAALPEIRQALEERLRKRLEDLDIEVNAERLEQELVHQAQRMDVDEEVDRLRAHLDEFRMQLDRDEAIGRRLDFLTQELNREANTLASKSQGIRTSQSAIEIKVCIEQIREQIQNIE